MRDWMACRDSVGVVLPADADAPALRLVEAAEQVDDGRLAAAGRTTSAIVSPRRNLQGEVGQHRLACLVVEVHVVELDVAADGARVDRARPVDDLRHGVDQREDALGRGDGMLHVGVDARQVLDRPHHEGDVAR